jgi:hypothetical protein
MFLIFVAINGYNDGIGIQGYESRLTANGENGRRLGVFPTSRGKHVIREPLFGWMEGSRCLATRGPILLADRLDWITVQVDAVLESIDLDTTLSPK